MRSAVIIGGARCPGDIGPAPTVAKRRDGADRTYPRGEPKSLQVRLPGNGAGVSRAKSRNGRRGYIEHYKNRNVSKCLISNRNLDKAKTAIFGISKNGERLVNT